MASQEAIQHFCTAEMFARLLDPSNVLEYVTAIHSAGFINDVSLWQCILQNIRQDVYDNIFQYVPPEVYISSALHDNCIRYDAPATPEQLEMVAHMIIELRSGHGFAVAQYLNGLPIREKINMIFALRQAIRTDTNTTHVIRSAAPVGVRTNSKGAEVVANVYTRVFDNDAEGVFQVKSANPADKALYDFVNTTDLPDGTVLPPQTGHTAAVGGLIFFKDEITVNIGTNTPPIICVLTSSNGTGHATLLIQNKGKLYNVGLLQEGAEGGILTPSGQIIFMSPDVILPTYEQSSQVVWVGLLTNEMVGKLNKYFNDCLELEFRIDEHGEVNRSLTLKYPVEKAQYLMVAHVTQGRHLNCLSWAQDIVGARLSCMTKANNFVPQPSGCTPVNADDFAKLIEMSKNSNYKDTATALIAGMQLSIGASWVERAAFGTAGVVAKVFGRGKSKRIKKVNRVKQVKTKNKRKTNKSRVRRY